MKVISMLAVLMLVGFTQPATAATAVPVKLTEPQQQMLKRVEDHLSGIKTMEARFVQVSSSGSFAEGRLYLSRPGKLRFEYLPPTPILIVSSGLVVTYYDRELEQVTQILLKATPLEFLVRENLKLSGDVTVTKFERRRGILRITVQETDSPEEGSITLAFSEAPLALRQWQVQDAQGVVTTVTLSNTRVGMTLDPKLFQFEEPKESKIDP
ncbi:MAG: outer-membrane lipoprotein carrier protein LolA [Proteobacteria bacterium]|nr:outer-membrane lipoprotein carrier protein LolA [Pseudomonadota bacterium]